MGKFLAGLLTGGAIAGLLGSLIGAGISAKKKDAEIQETIERMSDAAKEEAESIKSYYESKIKELEEQNNDIQFEKEIAEILESTENTDRDCCIRIISENSYGEMSGYDYESLIHYTDDVYTDERDRIISRERIDERIGHDNAEAIKNSANSVEDRLYYRNILKKCDYEIILETDDYETVTNRIY